MVTVMAECNKCGDEISMPYECNRCEKKFCSKHRLPEKHSCVMLDRGGPDAKMIEEKNKKSNSTVREKIPSADGFWDKVNGQMTQIFGVTFIVVYLLQILSLVVFDSPSVHNSLFVFRPEYVHYVWTWFTSMFAHSPFGFWHILGNGIVLIFFGTLLERKIGTKRYTALFFASGLIAGFSQVGLGILANNPTGVLGASGALMGVLGVLTVYNPRMTVYLYFFIPAPLWLVTIGFAGFSIFAAFSGGVVLGGVAHVAHIAGLVSGLLYGYKTKDRYNLSDEVDLSRRVR